MADAEEEQAEKEYAHLLKVTFGLQASETDHVPIHELKASLEAFCKQRNEEAPSLTRQLLGQFKMHLMHHKGERVVTGLTKRGPRRTEAEEAEAPAQIALSS